MRKKYKRLKDFSNISDIVINNFVRLQKIIDSNLHESTGDSFFLAHGQQQQRA